MPARVFRPYDIRGLVDSEMTDEFMQLLGRAVATESLERGTGSMLVGRDYRPSSEHLTAALIIGLRSSGCNVIDLGQVPTPVLYFASQLAGNISGAVVTASHHPIEYNGLKLVFAGQSATPLTIAKLRQRLQHGQFTSGDGSYHEQSVLTDYLDEIEQNIRLTRPLKIVVDGGFATPALVAPLLYQALGCEVIALRCDLNDAQAGVLIPNPAKIDSLQLLADQVLANGADLGLGFGGDGDRLGVIDSSGQMITTDRVLMVLATHLLSQLPGSDVLFDVKCSSRLAEIIHHHGGRPVMWKSGHAFLKEKRQELNAPLAGEFNGHIMFADRWNGFDDAFYAGARLLEILTQDSRPSNAVFADFPIGIATPELILPVATGEEQEIMAMVLEAKGRLSGVRVTTIDGLRIDSEQGWGLVRASNTEPALSFRFEADDQVTLNKLQDLFRRLMKVVAPKLTMPF
ncbi:phosphomannomutase/phosphoglucomutase [Thiospirillum jenense]|uniref:phosphomannomutase n=2 Tax=Thiospirillum jenense TaxID=1653858 RepID=A0A839HJS2_9GAMM|nr:phosphomannomutase/phosphoglucomutase [Thiospirillum jenense]